MTGYIEIMRHLRKRVYINKCGDKEVMSICNELTEFAAKAVAEQLALSKKDSPCPDKYKPTEDSCECPFFKMMKRLTCRHIMRVRHAAGKCVLRHLYKCYSAIYIFISSFFPLWY